MNNENKINTEIKNFDITTILTLITGYSLVDDFSKVFELVWFIYNDNMINVTGLDVVKDSVKNHLLTIHPELKNIRYQKCLDLSEFISEQTQKFGSILPVTRLGVKLPIEKATTGKTLTKKRKYRQGEYYELSN